MGESRKLSKKCIGLIKWLNSLNMKPNEDPSDLFKELSAIEHAYSGTQAKEE